MFVGLLSAPFNGEPVDTVIEFASDSGIKGLELTAGPGAHIDTATFNKKEAERIKELVAEGELEITGLAHYTNVCDGTTESSENFKKVVDAAVLLDIDVVCAFAGMPVQGKSRTETIKEVVPGVYRPLLNYAKDKGIKIALENWWGTNATHLGHWDLLFELLPDEHFGLNFDPSHLVLQGIDYLEAVDTYKDRIFHTHAKDTEIKEHVVRRLGNLFSFDEGWWRYVIPGFGVIDWGVYIERLYTIGYTGTLSIEHEDGAQGREEGFIRGARYLGQFVD